MWNRLNINFLWKRLSTTHNPISHKRKTNWMPIFLVKSNEVVRHLQPILNASPKPMSPQPMCSSMWRDPERYRHSKNHHTINCSRSLSITACNDLHGQPFYPFLWSRHTSLQKPNIHNPTWSSTYIWGVCCYYWPLWCGHAVPLTDSCLQLASRLTCMQVCSRALGLSVSSNPPHSGSRIVYYHVRSLSLLVKFDELLLMVRLPENIK